ncbi:aminotransferase [Candidatus Saccharibacteria bacterium]|nr:MAG: aminotransferase [Candidatus Saccharibacteria bacterium]
MSDVEQIYLDHAAATPLDQKVERAMQPFWRQLFFNPSSPYAPAVKVRRTIDQARHRLAISIGASQDDCIITAGATESINLAMTAAEGGQVITSAIEHPAVLESAKLYDHQIIGVSSDGLVDPESLAKSIQPETQLISISLANNELGTIQPLSKIAQIVQSERMRRQDVGGRRPIWLHADASQGVGQLDVHVGRLGVDVITINSGKIYGPKQVALLWRRPGVRLKPVIVGGGQELGLRSGTENVAGIIGFAEAMNQAELHRKSEAKRLAKLRDDMQRQIVSEFGDDVKVFGNQKRRLSSHLLLSFAGIDAERLVFLLENQGVLVSTGSACSANKHGGSHVLKAIGASPAEIAGSLRISLGRLNNPENTKLATERIISAVKSERERLGL